MASRAGVQLGPEQMHAIARALGEPKRFAIFEQIAATPALSCSSLDVQDVLSPATISHHLKELQDAGLVTAERDGRCMRLSVQRDVWNAYVAKLSRL